VFGSLGHGDSLRDVAHLEPVALPEGAGRIVRVSAGWGHSAAVTSEGRLLVFGRPYDFSNILQINRLHSFSPDLGRFVGRFTNNLAWFRGRNGPSQGQNQNQNQNQQSPPGNTKESGVFTVPTYFIVDTKGSMVETVSCSAGLTAALTLDGRVFCFGLNRWGQCGSVQQQQQQHVYEPRMVNLPERVAVVDVGLQHCVAVSHSGRVWTWGKGTRGQLGDGNNDTSSTPVEVKGVSTGATATGTGPVVSVSAGFNHTAALTADGRVFLWGKGMSTTPAPQKSGSRTQVYLDQPSPRLLPLLGQGLRVKEICSSNFTLVLRATDDSLWAMGIGEEDRCAVPEPVPVQQATVAGADVPAGQAVTSPQVVLGPDAVMRKGYQRVVLFDRGHSNGAEGGGANATVWSTYGQPSERVFEVVVHDGEAFLHPMDGMQALEGQESLLLGKRLLDLSRGWRQTIAVLE